MKNRADVVLDSPTTVERLKVQLFTPIDPTGLPVEFQLTSTRSTVDIPAPGEWVAGQWMADAWDGSGAVWALTPLIVSELGAEPNTTYRLWVRWSVGDQQPERLAGLVQIGGAG